VDCIGSDPTVVSNRQCNISLDTLKASPYSLILDNSVKAKVISVNVYGESEMSTEGSGAVI
jgi:hypothetical protein